MNLLCDQSAALRTHSPLAYLQGMWLRHNLKGSLHRTQWLSRGLLRRVLQLDLLVTVPVRVTIGLVLLLLCTASPVSAATSSPKLDIGKGGQCVEDPQWMRKNHMKLLKHERDEVVRKGLRDEKMSLVNCIECHASTRDDSVIARDDSFCVGCHRYEAVKTDCFECHSGIRRSAWLQRNAR